MSQPPIPPALTPEEWRAARRLPPGLVWTLPSEDGSFDRHHMAAICLYNQPYGFTRADVEILRGVSQDHALQTLRYHGETLGNLAGYLDSLADRISALLPPEGA